MADIETLSASLLADEVYYALFAHRTDDQQASCAFWRELAGEMVPREFVSGFLDGALSALPTPETSQ